MPRPVYLPTTSQPPLWSPMLGEHLLSSDTFEPLDGTNDFGVSLIADVFSYTGSGSGPNQVLLGILSSNTAVTDYDSIQMTVSYWVYWKWQFAKFNIPGTLDMAPRQIRFTSRIEPNLRRFDEMHGLRIYEPMGVHFFCRGTCALC